MNSMTRALVVPTGFIFLLFLFSAVAKAQETPGPAQNEQPKPAATSLAWVPNAEQAASEDTDLAPTGPPDPFAGSIKDVGTGLPLLGASSTPLRWGSFSVYTFEFMGIHDDFEAGGTSGSISTDLSIFRTGLMFDHYLLRKKSRIVLQYLPQMIIVNGQVHTNAATNNNVSAGTEFQLTPRLRLTVGDNFVQMHNDSLIPQNYLATNTQIGALAQNNFLNTNGDFLANTANATVEYGLTERTKMSFSPSFRYMHAINNTSNYLANGQGYTGTVALEHALSPHRTVGITGSYQYLNETIGGSPENATYYTGGLFYSEQLARSLWLSGNVGATDQKYSGVPQPGGWGLAAGLSLTKSFSPRIGAALGYTRGTIFSNYVSRQRSDRVDGSINVMVSSRISWTNAVGYLRELAGINPTAGKYLATDVTYRFFGNFSFFTTFAYTVQNAGTPQLFFGNRRTLAYGVRWLPGTVTK
jgi:hypothetical protein